MADDQGLMNDLNQSVAQEHAVANNSQFVAAQESTLMKGIGEGAAAIANGAQQMLASAQSGQLKFDPTTGQSLVTALNQHIDDLNTASRHISVISAKTPLGTTSGGNAMGAFNEQVASTGSQAFAPAHQQFIASLQSAVQAIQIAMDNYTKTEGDNAGKFKAKD